MNSHGEQFAAHTLDRVVQQIESCGLHKRTPYAIANVSMTQFSVARYAGACKYNGEHYIYWPHYDMLVREDVHRQLCKDMKKKPAVDATGSLLNPEGLRTRHLVEGTQHPLVGRPDDLTKNGQ